MDFRNKERTVERTDTWKLSTQAPPAAICENKLELQIVKPIKKSRAKPIIVKAKATSF